MTKKCTKILPVSRIFLLFVKGLFCCFLVKSKSTLPKTSRVLLLDDSLKRKIFYRRNHFSRKGKLFFLHKKKNVFVWAETEKELGLEALSEEEAVGITVMFANNYFDDAPIINGYPKRFVGMYSKTSFGKWFCNFHKSTSIYDLKCSVDCAQFIVVLHFSTIIRLIAFFPFIVPWKIKRNEQKKQKLIVKKKMKLAPSDIVVKVGG